MEKLTFSEVCKKFYEHNQQNNITTQYGDKKPLVAIVVFDNSSFTKEYPLESRSYSFRSDNKYFISGMGGNSIYGHSLDDADHIRLDWYLTEWKIEYCYIKE